MEWKSRITGHGTENPKQLLANECNWRAHPRPQQPAECMARPIRNHGDKDDDVYDPFLGSGTTMAVAESLGRTCYGLEIEPKYCAVILERMTNMGLEPKRIDEPDTLPHN